GAVTAIFTAANGLLLRAPSGVAEPDRLIDIIRTNGRFGVNPISYENYLDIRARTTTVADVYAYGLAPVPVGLNVNNNEGAEAIIGTVVTNNYFTALGVSPAVGRLLGPSDSERL